MRERGEHGHRVAARSRATGSRPARASTLTIRPTFSRIIARQAGSLASLSSTSWPDCGEAEQRQDRHREQHRQHQPADAPPDGLEHQPGIQADRAVHPDDDHDEQLQEGVERREAPVDRQDLAVVGGEVRARPRWPVAIAITWAISIGGSSRPSASCATSVALSASERRAAIAYSPSARWIVAAVASSHWPDAGASRAPSAWRARPPSPPASACRWPGWPDGRRRTPSGRGPTPASRCEPAPPLAYREL